MGATFAPYLMLLINPDTLFPLTDSLVELINVTKTKKILRDS